MTPHNIHTGGRDGLLDDVRIGDDDQHIDRIGVDAGDECDGHNGHVGNVRLIGFR